MTGGVVIVHHDCEVHGHDANIIGPFADEAAAWAFVEKHDLEIPSDGGYAFVVVVGPSLEPDRNPQEWDDE